jgi:serine/threonine protein kinase
MHPGEIGRLGNYRVLRLLGEGGMGLVFLGEDLTLQRQVALKVMKPDLASESDGGQRLLREARLMASIKHENLATIYQAGQEGPVVYLAMELLQGESLGERLLRAGMLRPANILRVGQQLAIGLAAIHGHGLVHRDLKPANIWLETPGNRVKILDFGLARPVREETSLTKAGIIMGTPAFMSPEQARGRPADARSDLFSLGCVLYSMATRVRPFDADNTLGVLSALVLHEPRPVRELNPAIPGALGELIMQLLAKDPAERPASAEEVGDRLRQIQRWLDEESATGELPPTVPSRLLDRPDCARQDWPSTVIRPGPQNKAPRQKSHRRHTWELILASSAGVLVAVIAWVIILKLLNLRGQQSPELQADGSVYLSSLDAIEPVNWPFQGFIPAGPVRGPEPADWPAPLGKVRVSVKGQVSPHGIFMHLLHEEPQRASVSFRLGKRYSTFSTTVSLNDGPPECTPLTFAVYGDGRLLWESRPVSSQADTQACTGLSVQGVEKLTLEVRCQGDERGTHAVWLEPQLMVAP